MKDEIVCTHRVFIIMLKLHNKFQAMIRYLIRLFIKLNNNRFRIISALNLQEIECKSFLKKYIDLLFII